MKKRRPRQVKSKVYNYQVSNRRRHSGSNRWIHGLIVLALIAVATGIVYVWQRNQLLSLGFTVNELGDDITALEQEETKLEAKLSELKEPSRIRRLVDERGLGLVAPTRDQVVRVGDPERIVLDDEGEDAVPLGRRLWNTFVLRER